MNGSQPTLRRESDVTWELPRTGNMRVPGRVYADDHLMRALERDQSLTQVQNVACLPGIVRYSLAMPDIHFGYGFPIGGVAAFRMDTGVVSPGGVGYDINCGVRLPPPPLNRTDVQDRLRPAIDQLFRDVPAVGSSGAIAKLSRAELERVVVQGAAWAVERGYGEIETLNTPRPEAVSPGQIRSASAPAPGNEAWTKWARSAPGNHFLEIQVVEEVFDKDAAVAFGLHQGQVTLMIHCGSRGFGYQVCDDYLEVMEQASRAYDIALPDRQLACARCRRPKAKTIWQPWPAPPTTLGPIGKCSCIWRNAPS